ncbi:MAG: glycosyltransferase, partial [Deltaproteobacteria bacterium]|nr:glycosyltransferase [Deltaproteobacteria bacterium]
DTHFRNLVKIGKVSLICFGHAGEGIEKVGIPVKALGYLDSEKELINAYCAADLFVLPSLEDNLPNTMLEAMSCGTPVVAFEVGGIPDGVKDGETGRLVPEGDAVEMGRAILSLISNSEKRRVMGKACRRRVEEHYSLDIQAGAYADLYKELMESEAPGRSEAEDRISRVWQVPVSSNQRPLSVPLECEVGPHFKEIHASVLFKALKEFSIYAYKKWQASEADRAARRVVIETQGKRISELESEVDRWLGESERLQQEYSDAERKRNGWSADRAGVAEGTIRKCRS